MKPIRISEAEWQVMSLAWERPPIVAADVVEKLTQSTGWHSRTIRTLLDRLFKKGALKAAREGKRYLYTPLVSLEECVKQESQSFLERVFGGEPAPLLLHLVKESNLSKAEIRDLKRLLSEKER